MPLQLKCHWNGYNLIKKKQLWWKKLWYKTCKKKLFIYKYIYIWCKKKKLWTNLCDKKNLDKTNSDNKFSDDIFWNGKKYVLEN